MSKSRYKDFMASTLERRSYETYFFGQNIVYTVLTVYLAVYYAKSLGIPAVTISVIMFAAKAWDALMDPILAAIIEKSNFKSGKFRPWVRIAAFSVPIISLVCFSFGNYLISQPMAVRIIYATVTFFVWGTIYAASDAPAYAIVTHMTSNNDERTLMYNYNKFTSNIGTFLVYGAFMIVLEWLSNDWFLTVSIYMVLALATMMLIYTAKERVKSERTQQPSLKDIGRAVVRNKYFLVFILVNLIVNASNFITIMVPFVGTDIYQRSDSIMYIMIATFAPILAAAPLMNPLLRKFGKIHVYGMSLILGAAISVVMFFTCRTNLTLCLILAVIRGFATAPQYIIYSLFFADTIEYNYYKNGTRFEAVTFAAQTFVAKVSGAVCSAAGMGIIGLFGYISTTEGQVVTQPASALDALWAVAIIGPAVGSVIAAFILYKFYDLNDKKLAFIEAENAKRVGSEARG